MHVQPLTAIATVPSRPVDRDRAEQELSGSVKKALTADEVAPKTKHVRSKPKLSDTRWAGGLSTFIRCVNRMHRLYLGLSFLDFDLELLTCLAHPVGRDHDLQSPHIGAQGPARGS